MITAFIKGQAIETTESVIVAESLNYLKAQFVFVTNDWNGLEKTAYFTQGNTTHTIDLDENNIAFPLHLSAGEWAVSVVGREYKNGELVERITSDTAKITVKPFKAGKETPFPEPTPTEIERVEGKIGYLPDLLTRDKTSLVNAINEVYKRGGSGGGGGSGGDGFSPIIDITEIEGGHRVTITDIDGTKSFDILNGYTPVKGVDYFDGKDGINGKDGKDGYTPQKGIDYFDGNDYILTESDKTEIANAVLDEIPDISTKTSDYINPYSEGSEVVAETDDEQRVIDAYQNMMSECMGDSEKIPFLLQTDNHNYFPKSIYNLCAKMINFAQFSQVLTLGDIAGNYFHETHLQNFVDAMKAFPIEKKTAIAGNHDVWVGASDRSYIDQAKLSKYLKNYTLRRYGTNGYGVLIDDYFNMKYLIISNYDKDEGESGSRISTKQVNFIVDELSKNDGYDVVILSHEPISLSDSTTTALLEAGSYTTMGNYFSFIPSRNGFIAMLLARKNKGSGTYTDDEGVEHAYDFTNCNSELLCCFCGHTHVEGFDFINGQLLNVAWGGINHADGHPIYFGYIDKKNRLLKYYRVAGDYSASVTVGLDKVNATNMTLDKTEISMNVGELEVISPVFTPITAGNQRVNWSSSDSAVAIVKKGFVSGIAEGTATITAISEDGNFTATCLVTVGTPEEPEEPDIPDVPDEPDVPDRPASNLPTEYQEVDYLYTTVKDVSCVPTATSFAVGDKGYITAEYTYLYNTDTAICGAQGKAEIYVNKSRQLQHYASVELVNPTNGSVIEENKVYNVEFDFTGVVSNLALMAYNTTSKYGMHGKMYSASFYRGDTLIYNFVPCYRKADGKIGMYDTVNNVFAEGVGELFAGGEFQWIKTH